MITSPISRMITKHCIFFCSMHTDLSTNTCIGCLNDEITIPWSSLGSLGGRVLYPSCILRFEFFPFHDLMMSTTIIIIISGHHHHQEMASHIWKIILILTLTITVSGILFTFCYYLIRRKTRKNNKIILSKNFGREKLHN